MYRSKAEALGRCLMLPLPLGGSWGVYFVILYSMCSFGAGFVPGSGGICVGPM